MSLDIFLNSSNSRFVVMGSVVSENTLIATGTRLLETKNFLVVKTPSNTLEETPLPIGIWPSTKPQHVQFRSVTFTYFKIYPKDISCWFYAQTSRNCFLFLDLRSGGRWPEERNGNGSKAPEKSLQNKAALGYWNAGFFPDELKPWNTSCPG